MLEINETNARAWSAMGSRGVFGKVLLDVAEQIPDVVAITADLADSTRLLEFADRFPERFFQVGVAEQNLVGVASGLALGGKIPFATTFGSFAATRCCEQVRTDVAYPNLNVKLIGAESGIAQGTTGTTHYGLEDLGIMRCIANLVVLSPADGAEIVQAVWAAVRHEGPVYIRLTGGAGMPIIYRRDYAFAIGQAVTLREGRDATLIATGTMVARALQVADVLGSRGVAARVIDMHTIKPIDAEAIRQAARDTGLIVTVEEHNVTGGLGSAVAEVLAGLGNAPRQIRLGLPDAFGKIASFEFYLERAGLSVASIAGTVAAGLHL